LAHQPQSNSALKRTTLFTCSIYPDLTRVWYHFARRYTDEAKVTMLIYDCGGQLRREYFPGATIFRHRNTDHGTKIDHCLRDHAATPLLFLSDDDCFILDREAEPLAAERLLGHERAAALSFKPRGWWEWCLDGRRHPVMGSYSLVFKPEIIARENLSFRTRHTTDPRVRQGSGYYDTADHVNEALLTRGYDVLVPEVDIRQRLVRSYSAVSSGFVNFAKRRWLRSGYRISRPWRRWAGEFLRDDRKLEWACGVAATVRLHRLLFAEPPLFTDFGDYADLLELAQKHSEPDQAVRRTAMVTGYHDLLRTLEAAL
jgi:hypothetical protein